MPNVIRAKPGFVLCKDLKDLYFIHLLLAKNRRFWAVAQNCDSELRFRNKMREDFKTALETENRWVSLFLCFAARFTQRFFQHFFAFSETWLQLWRCPWALQCRRDTDELLRD
jgi:hypothetical protein